MFLAALIVAVVVALAVPAASSAADASVRFDPRHMQGGEIEPHFVGLSIEWSLIERYMGPDARPAFANLLRNLGGGVLRIGGSSQDLMPFDATAPNSLRVITPEDLRFIRSTIDAANEGGPRGVSASAPRWRRPGRRGRS